MGPDGDPGFAPGDTDLWMVIHGLGQLSHVIRKIERFLEVAEIKGLLQVMFIDDLPTASELRVDGV